MYAACSNIAYMEDAMPLLQVRDFPEDLYEKLARIAETDHRSIAQETIVLLRDILGQKQERIAKRRNLFEEIQSQTIPHIDEFFQAADLVRENRER